MSLEHRIIPANAFKTVRQKDTEPTERAPSDQSWNNLSNKVNNVVLGYDPKFKINIHYPYDMNE